MPDESSVAQSAQRMSRDNSLAGWSFTLGGSLFAAGAFLAQTGAEVVAVNVALVNWGTFAGAVCFAVAGIVQVGVMHRGRWGTT